jgi:hypothetical protein
MTPRRDCMYHPEQPEREAMASTDIGSRLELFVDDVLVDRLEGDAEFQLHRPQARNVVLTDDRPWESSTAYFAVRKDDGVFRMYYRGFHHGTDEKALGEPTCYAESRDGIDWAKPNLGLFTFEGSPDNNIVLGGDLGKFPATKEWRGDLGTDIRWRADFVPFRDERPGVDDDARFKALIRGSRGFPQIADRCWAYGMYPFQSPDGLHWTLLTDKPVITRGRFDSQNLAFWDAVHGRYVAFVRDCRWGRDVTAPADVRDFERVPKGVWRDVRVCVSDDFIHWSDPVFVEYPGAPREELYTNAVTPYERAPHLLLGFPTRFLTETEQTEPILMVSRDGGSSFHRWPDALIPRDAPEERDGNRSNYMAQGLVRGTEREYFVYATEGYQDGPSRRLRRFSYRVDGFVSVRAGPDGGALVTTPITFAGGALVVNYAAAPGGSLRVELLDVDGEPLPGLDAVHSRELRGDAIEESVTWRDEVDLARVAGTPVRLRFRLLEADLFSYRFADQAG